MGQIPVWGVCETTNVSLTDTERSDQVTGEKKGGDIGGVCQGNGKQSRMGLAERLDSYGVCGIIS